MKYYYERRLLGIEQSHPGHIRIAKRFLCPGWEAIDAENIRQSEINMEFLVPSQKKGTALFYTVNIELYICICFIGLSGAPCKHQGA
ncbi:39259_t:CDS:1, partial [Gigaspora margarita]